MIPTNSSPWLRVIHLAWPVLIQQFLSLFLGLSDQFLAGYLTPPPGVTTTAYQSALTTANYASWFISSALTLVSVGATALVARAVGERDWQLARKSTHQSILLALVLGGLGGLIGWQWLESGVWLLGLTGEAARQTIAFLTPLLLMLLFEAIQLAGVACLAGAGDTRSGLWISGGVALVNIPLAWALGFGIGPIPALGFIGIALGTALSHVLGAMAVLAVLRCGRAGLSFDLGELWPNLGLLGRLLRVSGPATADSLSVVGFQFWFLSIVNHLGDEAAAAHGIALRWEALGFLSGHAFGTAAMTLVGQGLGAGKPSDSARCGWAAFGWACGVMSLMGVVFFVLAYPMFWLFCPSVEQTAVVETGVPVLRLVAFSMPALASAIVFTAALRGAGDTRVPLVITWIGYLGVRIPLAYLLTRDFLPGWNLGLLGAWLAMCADLWVRGLCFLWRFHSGHWQKIKV